MKRRTKKIIGAVAVIGAVAAGGAAYTAANTIPDTVAGYGTSHITGAVATNLKYTLNNDGTEIVAADLTFQGDQTPNTVKAGFGTDALTTCVVGSYTPGTPGSTDVQCSGYTQPTDTASLFNVAVTNTN